MEHERRKFLLTQQAVSVVLNAIISALFVWLVFGGLERIGLWGAAGLALDLVPTTFMITLMMGIALTLITRGAVRKGQLAPVPASTILPRSVFVRAPLLAFAATIILVPVTVALLWLLWERDWTYGEVMAFKIAYGIALGAIVTPIVIGAALRDRPANPTIA
jgi:hypothetical protein